MSETFTHWVEVTPSYYKMPTYGVANCRITFFCRGEKGAVQWMIGTEWGIKAVRDHLSRFPSKPDEMRQPYGWDLGYHSPKPLYEGQTVQSENCTILGGRCFYDGSGLNADMVIEGFLAGGTDWLWPKLEQYYRHVFEDTEYPDFSPPPEKTGEA